MSLRSTYGRAYMLCTRGPFKKGLCNGVGPEGCQALPGSMALPENGYLIDVEDVEVRAKIDETLDDRRGPIPQRLHQRILQKVTLEFHAKT